MVCTGLPQIPSRSPSRLQFLLSVVHNKVGRILLGPVGVGAVFHRAALDRSTTQAKDTVGVGGEVPNCSHLPVGTWKVGPFFLGISPKT